MFLQFGRLTDIHKTKINSKELLRKLNNIAQSKIKCNHYEVITERYYQPKTRGYKVTKKCPTCGKKWQYTN